MIYLCGSKDANSSQQVYYSNAARFNSLITVLTVLPPAVAFETSLFPAQSTSYSSQTKQQLFPDTTLTGTSL